MRVTFSGLLHSTFHGSIRPVGFIASFIVRVLLNAVVLYVADRLLIGFTLIPGWETLILASVLLAFLHTFIKPVVRILSLPLIWITLGIFNLVINLAILWMADVLLPGIVIADFFTLFVLSFIIALTNSFV